MSVDLELEKMAQNYANDKMPDIASYQAVNRSMEERMIWTRLIEAFKFGFIQGVKDAEKAGREDVVTTN